MKSFPAAQSFLGKRHTATMALVYYSHYFGREGTFGKEEAFAEWQLVGRGVPPEQLAFLAPGSRLSE